MERTVLTATDFGKVAVLMGGQSAERAISLTSGKAVLAALLEQNIDAHKIDVNDDIGEQLFEKGFDRAFVILHGRGGEDGEIQGLLDLLAIPYTGSDMSGSVFSMNKMVSKQFWQKQGLPTPKYVQVSLDSDVEDVVNKVGLPLFIKPVNEGSSIGMSKVNSADQLDDAIALASQYDAEVIAEHWIDGDEYTVAILNDTALPVIRLTTPNDFYDFEAKYQSDTTGYICPCGLSEEDEIECQQLALEAFKCLQMAGWGRIDFMRDKQQQFHLIEANSIPGMTDHSLVPMAAKQAGLTFNDLVWHILETSMGGTE